MKTLETAFFLLILIPACSQELVETEYEKGYIKDGRKYLVWDYFDDHKELELKMNHTTGKIYFLKEDTTDFVIYRDSEWVAQKLRLYPIPIGGYSLFYNTVKRNLRYPAQARIKGIDGQVMVMFEIDSIGFPSNYSIVKNIGGGLAEEVIRALKQNSAQWIQAQANNKLYRSRFILPVTFGLGKGPKVKRPRDLPLARMLNEIAIIAMGVDAPPR